MRKFITEIDTFTSTITGQAFKIKHRFEWDDKFSVYLLSCNVNSVNSSTLIKQQTNYLVNGPTKSLKVEVLIEENSE